MKFMKISAVILCVTFILNCTKKEEVKTYDQYEENGIRITSNNGTPADTTFSVELKEVGAIDVSGGDDPENIIGFAIAFDFDEEGNMYLLDYKKCKIHKFNNKYERIGVFGGKGNGPGEFVEASSMAIKNDTILVSDSRSWKVSKLDLDGNFINDKKYLNYEQAPTKLEKLGMNFISKFYGMSSDESGQRFSREFVTLLDSNLNYVKDVYNFKKLYVENQVEDPGADGSTHAANSKNLFLSVNSKTDYKIDVYDINGDKKRVIRKNYARIKNSEEAIKWQEEFNKKNGTKYKTEFKNSIFKLYTDKYDRLWVHSTVKEKEEGVNYDVFRNDIFLKRVKLKLEKGYMPIYIGEKLICQNWQENIMKIYDY